MEKDLWLNVVITHPEDLYGSNKGQADKDENALAGGETIANADFQYSAFKEEDGKIFCKVINSFVNYWSLFHGPIAQCLEKHSA